MNATCPCCGADVEPTGLLVDLNNNTISRFGRTVLVTPREAEILTTIVGAYPGRIRVDRLLERVYGLMPAPSRRSMCIFITRLRQKLKPLGITIAPGFNGYALRLDDKPFLRGRLKEAA